MTLTMKQSGDTAKRIDCMWMSLEPTWKLLAKALSEPSIGFSQKASKSHKNTVSIPHIIIQLLY